MKWVSKKKQKCKNREFNEGLIGFVRNAARDHGRLARKSFILAQF
jgi:hypothetical protein